MTDNSYRALLAGVLAGVAGLACTGPNPAFRPESLAPRTERPDAKAADAGRPDRGTGSGEPGDAPADMAPAVDVVTEDAADLGSFTPSSDDAAIADAGTEAPDGPPDSSLAVGLVVRYPLDLVGTEVVADVSGARAGAMHGGAGWSSAGFPGAQFANGGALVLDGMSGYVTLPPAGLPTVAATKSVSLWFWQASPISNLRKTLLAFSNPVQSVGVNIGLQNGVPAVWFWRQLIGTAIVSAAQPSPAGWTHMVFVQQGTAQRLYVNGTLVDSTAATLASGTVTSFMLGAYATDLGEDELWSGRLDDVRVYSRALTAAEVKALATGAP